MLKKYKNLFLFSSFSFPLYFLSLSFFSLLYFLVFFSAFFFFLFLLHKNPSDILSSRAIVCRALFTRSASFVCASVFFLSYSLSLLSFLLFFFFFLSIIYTVYIFQNSTRFVQN
ncbi:hypothetical protein ES288_D01G027700v1 [Gossypium darwinii]|uniref:Uncharacterized protein n=1 Tax=Gossypium darwinii TaxID=34276 RepID=A0A5D2DJV6_GOSDA|nr:hypothetical protein ES288_D01G027700v1 [Gossypium darwinii]